MNKLEWNTDWELNFLELNKYHLGVHKLINTLDMMVMDSESRLHIHDKKVCHGPDLCIHCSIDQNIHTLIDDYFLPLIDCLRDEMNLYLREAKHYFNNGDEVLFEREKREYVFNLAELIHILRNEAFDRKMRSRFVVDVKRWFIMHMKCIEFFSQQMSNHYLHDDASLKA